MIVAEKRALAAYEDYFSLGELLDRVSETTGLL